MDKATCQPCINTHGDTTHRHTHRHTLPCVCAIQAQVAASANGPQTGLSPTAMSDTDNLRLQRHTRNVHFDDIHLVVAKEVAIPSATNDTRYQTWGTVATVLRQDEQLSEAALIYAYEIERDKKDMFAPFCEPLKSTDELSDQEFLAKIKIEGSEQPQGRIETSCLKYKGIFSEKAKPVC
jgi:hypothetical protein